VVGAAASDMCSAYESRRRLERVRVACMYEIRVQPRLGQHGDTHHSTDTHRGAPTLQAAQRPCFSFVQLVASDVAGEKGHGPAGTRAAVGSTAAQQWAHRYHAIIQHGLYHSIIQETSFISVLPEPRTLL